MENGTSQTAVLPDAEDKAWARAWFDKHLPHVPRETWLRLELYVALLLAEAQRQNLIAASTVPLIWSRHIVDSLQLLLHIPPDYDARTWIDVGSGAGLPAIPVALCRTGAVHAVESRALRCGFLRQMASALNLSQQLTVHEIQISQCNFRDVAVISARAFAPLPKIVMQLNRFAGTNTFWVLPKGKNAATEVSMTHPSQQAMFHVKPSCTDPFARILVAKGRFNLGLTVKKSKKSREAKAYKKADAA